MPEMHEVVPYLFEGSSDGFLSAARASTKIWETNIRDLDYRTSLAGGQLEKDGQTATGLFQLSMYPQRAWRPVLQATNHLSAAFALNGDEEPKAVWPAPHAVLARSALLGSAKVVYLLRPNSSRERVRRALLLSQGELSGALQLNKEIVDIADAATTDLDTDIDLLRRALHDRKRRTEKLRGDLTEVLRKRGETRLANNGTGEGHIIKEAAQILNNEGELLHAVTSWHVGSLAAHSNLAGFEYFKELEENTSPGEALADILAPAVVLTNAAWQLWEHRRDEPTRAD